MPTEVITGELRDIGLWQSLHLITQKKFTLQPINKLGEHFMKLVRPDDTLRTIAMHCREFDVLAGESRQTLEDLVMADRFRDLDHMADYLQHGPAALSHLIRLRHEGRQLDLPASAQELLDFAGGSPRKILLSDVEYVPLNAQGKELLIRLNPYDNLGVANLAGTLMGVPDITASAGEVVNSARSLLPKATQPVEYFCPLKVSVEVEDSAYLVG